MITLANTTFYNQTHVQRAYDLLYARNMNKCNLSQYEATLGKAMYKYLLSVGGILKP